MADKKIRLTLVACVLGVSVCAANTPEETLAKALAYHDPAGTWPTLAAEFRFAESRPDGEDTRSVMRLDNRRTYMHVDFAGKETYEITGETCVVIKGDKDQERGLGIRNYFLYLWGLPMKLTDPGTTFDPVVGASEIDGAACDVIRVNYEKDLWFFHIDRESGRLRQYEFYWDEEKTKGEIITLEDEVELGSLRIPQKRAWFQMPGRKYLGTDTLQSIRLLN